MRAAYTPLSGSPLLWKLVSGCMRAAYTPPAEPALPLPAAVETGLGSGAAAPNPAGCRRIAGKRKAPLGGA